MRSVLEGWLHHGGDSGDPVLHDSFDSELHRDRRCRAADTRSRQANGNHSTDLIDVEQLDISPVGLDGRSDDLDNFFNVGEQVMNSKRQPVGRTIR